jgi:hypothetical protein
MSHDLKRLYLGPKMMSQKMTLPGERGAKHEIHMVDLNRCYLSSEINFCARGTYSLAG